VLIGDDVALLAGKREEAIREVLKICGVFLGARIVH